MSLLGHQRSRIFIVEDESIVAMDLEASLERLGYVIVGITTSGEEALQRVTQLLPDLVLMDIQLSGDLDGLATAALIQRHHGIPVVFLTANFSEQTIARAKQPGSYGFLNKPFRPTELQATIEIALHQHRAGKTLSEERARLHEEVQHTSEALGQTREELQALSRHLMTAQEEERRRVARELHDDLSQQAALMSIQLDRFGRTLRPCPPQFTAIRASLDRLAKTLREVSHRLHPSILEDLGLGAAIDSLVSDFRQQGLAVASSIAAMDQVPLDVSTSLLRIAQESLRNSLRHAPQAEVRLSLYTNQDEVILQISDDGPGFQLADRARGGGLGLISMQERARLVGGTLMLSTEPGRGTTVVARVPLRP